MMSRNWKFLTCLGVCLLALSLDASALVNDPNIISGAVTVNGTAPESPEIVGGGLFPGVTSHVDRDYVILDTAHRSGIDFVKTMVDDKNDPDVEYQITVNKSGTLYLLIDNRVGDDEMSDPPTFDSVMTWVDPNGFTQSDFSIVVSGSPDVTMTAYEKAVTAGTYTLHEQYDGTGRVTYLVAAVPDNFNYPPEITDVASSYQVEPGEDLVIDANVIDYFGDNVGVASYLWEQLDANPAVSFSPDAASEDVTISFPELGDYTIRLTATDDDGGQATKTIEVSVQIPTFAVTGFQQLTACNDSDKGPTSHYTTSVYHVRNYNDGSNTRRRAGFQKYDISDLKQEGKKFANCYLNWDFKKRSSGKSVYVYAITEAQDDFDLSASSAYWASVPGVKNDWPRGAEITIDTLDRPDLSPLLLSYEPPSTETWLSTPTSAALDEVMNADTDGTIMLMFISYDAESSSFDIEPYSISGNTEPETGLKGIIIRGNVMTPTWATVPVPDINTSQSTSLAQLSWTNPPAVGNLTSEVWIGQGDPNVPVGSGDGFYKLPDGDTSDNTVSLAGSGYTLTSNQEYNWVVNLTDDGTGVTTQGYTWTFNTNNVYPTVTMEKDYQYLWLNNNGDPGSATAVINATADDPDNFPNPTLDLLWEQVSGPATVMIDPNDIEDITLTLPATGTYVFQLSANDGDLTGIGLTQIFVGATPCLAAQANPDYEQMAADIVEDCYVDLSDLSALASSWLECNSTLLDIGGSCN